MPDLRGLLALANYISVWTRPDITYVVNKLCKYMANAADSHVDAFERLLRYLIGTRDLGLVYAFDGAAPPVVAYSDSSHMDCVDTSRSTLAYLFFLYGQIVTWYSKLHTFVTTCSNHSEYAAMFQAAKEAQSIFNWLAPLLSVLGVSVVPIPIFNDNDGASALALDPVGRFKNKHVRMEHHYTQELVAANVIIPVRVSTEENKSDLLTKALGPTVFPKIARSLVGPVSASPMARTFMFSAIGENSASLPTSDNGEAKSEMLGSDADMAADMAGHAECLRDPATHVPLLETLRVNDVLRSTIEFSTVMCSVSQVLALQQKRMLDAAATLHTRLNELLQSASVRVAPVQLSPVAPVQSSPVVEPGSDFVDDEQIQCLVPDASAFEVLDEVKFSAPEPDGVEGQVEYFQNPVARDGVEGQAEYFRDLGAWFGPSPYPIADPHADHAVPAKCTYCRKGGHSVEGCKRRRNDQAYLKPRKRR
jgi:hypothetical protein